MQTYLCFLDRDYNYIWEVRFYSVTPSKVTAEMTEMCEAVVLCGNNQHLSPLG